MLEGIRSVLPQSIKRAVRRGLLDPLQIRFSDWRLQRSVDSLRANPLPGRSIIENIRRAWGNESFSADLTYIGEIVNRIGHCNAPVLDCGSGVTTLVAGLIGERRNTVFGASSKIPSGPIL